MLSLLLDEQISPVVSEQVALRRPDIAIQLVNRRTIRTHDFGRLIRALEHLWDLEHQRVWTNRVHFLGRA